MYFRCFSRFKKKRAGCDFSFTRNINFDKKNNFKTVRLVSKCAGYNSSVEKQLQQYRLGRVVSLKHFLAQHAVEVSHYLGLFLHFMDLCIWQVRLKGMLLHNLHAYICNTFSWGQAIAKEMLTDIPALQRCRKPVPFFSERSSRNRPLLLSLIPMPAYEIFM